MVARLTVAEDALARVHSADPPPESGVFTDVLSADEAAAWRADGTGFCAYIESQMPRLCQETMLGAFLRGTYAMADGRARFVMVINPNPYRSDSQEREIVITCDVPEGISPTITITGERPNAQQDIARHIGTFAREHTVLSQTSSEEAAPAPVRLRSLSFDSPMEKNGPRP